MVDTVLNYVRTVQSCFLKITSVWFPITAVVSDGLYNRLLCLIGKLFAFVLMSSAFYCKATVKRATKTRKLFCNIAAVRCSAFYNPCLNLSCNK